MVTVVNTPQGTTERSTVERTSDDTSAGWAVAVIVLLAIVAVGGFLWLRAHPITYGNGAATPNNINVTLPNGSTQTTPPSQNNVNNVTPSTPAPRTQNINVTPTTPAPTP